jgi:hypothetical protein
MLLMTLPRDPRERSADTTGSGQQPETGFRFREEDDLRASFPGGFNGASGGGDNGGAMPGGFGGDGYNHYGQTSGTGAQGGGAEGPAYFGDHGSNPDGTPRTTGSEGEENFDRDSRPEVSPGATGTGTAQFSNETAGYARETRSGEAPDKS